MNTHQAKIEILPTTLLDDYRPLVQELKQTAAALGLEFGWHYLLDLTWIISQLGELGGQRVMDAGAGVGVMQWYLAEKGAQVTSVDRSSRADLAAKFRTRYQVRGLRLEDLHPMSQVLQHQLSTGNMAGFSRDLSQTLVGSMKTKAPGTIKIYNQDLRTLPELADGTFDAVVAVSALEHNPPENLAIVSRELMRVLKPGGVLLATLGAARERDWFHEASQGWCYTAGTLRKVFDLPPGTPDNYDRYDELFAALAMNAELRDHLASFYSKSGENGMPWGKWDPQYQPVGVCKVKEVSDHEF
jgi:2-polyprenyl-3-methyl-5-hydroxy-6-metoxy-1,4-benzoquinol methylase